MHFAVGATSVYQTALPMPRQRKNTKIVMMYERNLTRVPTETEEIFLNLNLLLIVIIHFQNMRDSEIIPKKKRKKKNKLPKTVKEENTRDFEIMSNILKS